MSLDALREITKENRWQAVAESFLFNNTSFPAGSDDFETFWIEAGHRIREQIANDQLLSHLLRRLLPPYIGSSMTLYRGENLSRWNQGVIGFSWTENIEVAQMFARGLNAIHSGGVLLCGQFSPDAIISGPNNHSEYLQEFQFTIDPFLANGIEQIEIYPPQ